MASGQDCVISHSSGIETHEAGFKQMVDADIAGFSIICP
jgi:hypothetical protein